MLNPDAHIQTFANWGYPLWFLYLTGVIEVGGAIGLFIPATRLYAALMLTMTMIGAAMTHLVEEEMAAVPIPLIVLLLLLICLVWISRSSKTS